MTVYEEAIRNYVCSRCIDLGEDGLCHSKDAQGCAIFRFLPELIGIAERIQSLRVDSYAKAIRENLCTYCWNQHPDGSCDIRQILDCALDRYLPLVLEAIENAQIESLEMECHGNGRRK